MQLPAPIQGYFDADRDPGGAAPIGVFAADAIVRDEGKTHIGQEAIAAWWRAAKSEFQHTSDPSDASERGGLTIVRATVTGRFPGSPALLTFVFQLTGGRIAGLEIRP